MAKRIGQKARESKPRKRVVLSWSWTSVLLGEVQYTLMPRLFDGRLRGFAFWFCFAFADFGGADFAHGGVAGAVAGSPHVPAGDGAVRTPALAESEKFFGFRHVLFAVGDGPAFFYAEVVDGENVWAAQADNQKHFHRPGAD